MQKELRESKRRSTYLLVLLTENTYTRPLASSHSYRCIGPKLFQYVVIKLDIVTTLTRTSQLAIGFGIEMVLLEHGKVIDIICVMF